MVETANHQVENENFHLATRRGIIVKIPTMIGGITALLIATLGSVAAGQGEAEKQSPSRVIVRDNAPDWAKDYLARCITATKYRIDSIADEIKKTQKVITAKQRGRIDKKATGNIVASSNTPWIFPSREARDKSIQADKDSILSWQQEMKELKDGSRIEYPPIIDPDGDGQLQLNNVGRIDWIDVGQVGSSGDTITAKFQYLILDRGGEGTGRNAPVRAGSAEAQARQYEASLKRYTYKKSPLVILSGIDTTGIVDGARLNLQRVFRVTGTRQVTAVTDAHLTLFELQPVDLSQFLKEEVQEGK